MQSRVGLSFHSCVGDLPKDVAIRDDGPPLALDLPGAVAGGGGEPARRGAARPLMAQPRRRGAAALPPLDVAALTPPVSGRGSMRIGRDTARLRARAINWRAEPKVRGACLGGSGVCACVPRVSRRTHPTLRAHALLSVACRGSPYHPCCGRSSGCESPAAPGYDQSSLGPVR